MKKPTITVVGLGTGNADQLTLGIWRKLQSAAHRYVRTDDHPMMQLFRENDMSYSSFDSLYEQLDSFPDVYEAIAAALIKEALQLAAAADTPDDDAIKAASTPASSTLSASGSNNEIIYAVPGHPMVAERTVQLLRERCPNEGITLTDFRRRELPRSSLYASGL